jgi:hypothetical protein
MYVTNFQPEGRREGRKKNTRKIKVGMECNIKISLKEKVCEHGLD